MLPVMQTRTGMTGNCFAACLAALLDCSLLAIPEFPDDDDEFIEAVQAFLAPRGKFYFQLKPGDDMLDSIFGTGFTFHTVEGRSPRSGQHACVGVNGKIIHDPHPGGVGLAHIEVFGFLGDRL